MTVRSSRREDRLDETELAQAAFEGVELVVADPPRVGGIGTEVVDRNLIDDEGRAGHRGGHAVFTRAAASWSSRPSIGIR